VSGPDWCRWEADTLWLLVRLQPRASRDEVVGPQGDRLKVRVTAPPVEGAANQQLVRLMARELGVPASRVAVVAGLASREKRLSVRLPRRRPGWLPEACLEGPAARSA
jgi:uncharacterized protein (TIGR00251 family)